MSDRGKLLKSVGFTGDAMVYLTRKYSPHLIWFIRFPYSRTSFSPGKFSLPCPREKKTISFSCTVLYLSFDISSLISVSIQHIIRFVAEEGHLSSYYTRKGWRCVLKTDFRVIRKRNREKQRNMMTKVLSHKSDKKHTKYYAHPAKHFCSHLHPEAGVKIGTLFLCLYG